MTQEQKELLLKDLCTRLPYGVKVLYNEKIYNISVVSICNETITIYGERGYPIEVEIQKVKPYLFPPSSITEEQMEELKGLCNMFNPDYYYPYAYWGIGVLYRHILDDNYKFDFKTDVIDWFHKNHIDYRGLIPMGLANDTTRLNIY